MGKTIRLTMAQAIVHFMKAQMTIIDGEKLPIFGGMWAIFGHGNVAGMGEALYAAAQRGVKITVLLQGKSDHQLFRYATQTLYATALAAGPVPDETVLDTPHGGTAVGLAVLQDRDGLFAQRYDARPGTSYLVRPDQHVAARWRAFEPAKIEAALRYNGGNVSLTARYLGVSRATLYRKIQIQKARGEA